MEANEVVKLAKKEAEVKIADLPERYIEKIAKDIARYVVYGWREGYDNTCFVETRQKEGH